MYLSHFTLYIQIHFVHYKKSYGSMGEAAKHSDGLAVVGAMINVEENNNLFISQMDKDLQALSAITESGMPYGDDKQNQLTAWV